MEELKEWYQEAKLVCPSHVVLNESFIIYKGFKISEGLDGTLIIYDTRFSNMYSSVSSTSLTVFKKHGFIKGCDIISYKRDTRRIESYKRRTARLYDRRRKFRSELPKNRALNEKRIRNINRRISEYVDMIFFYDTRVKHFNNKYKLN